MVDLKSAYREKAIELTKLGLEDKAKLLLQAANRIDLQTPLTTFKSSKKQNDTYAYYVTNLMDAIWSGEKFPGGFGLTKDYCYVDYWTLRKRSIQLFTENLYAKGVIRRLLTNEIHKGLNLEANNITEITELTDEQAIPWNESVELEFKLWGDTKKVCDWKQQDTFGELQKNCRLTALISGDCLVILHINQKTNLPSIELIDGVLVLTQ